MLRDGDILLVVFVVLQSAYLFLISPPRTFVWRPDSEILFARYGASIWLGVIFLKIWTIYMWAVGLETHFSLDGHPLYAESIHVILERVQGKLLGDYTLLLLIVFEALLAFPFGIIQLRRGIPTIFHGKPISRSVVFFGTCFLLPAWALLAWSVSQSSLYAQFLATGLRLGYFLAPVWIGASLPVLLVSFGMKPRRQEGGFVGK
jgi:hypothetical protein